MELNSMSRSKPFIPPEGEFSDDLFSVDKKRLRLLVVDDNASFCLLVQEHAEILDFQCSIDCRVVTSGTDAVKVVNSWHPSCVLLNVHIHDGNAFELLKRWRDGLTTVVAMSDQRSQEIEDSVKEHGADAYYARTDNPEELLQLLEEVIANVPVLPDVH
jgi:DNA-binding response OmpR family regulator